MVDNLENYPVNLQIEYPETSDKLTTFFRLILVLPIFLILILLLSNGADADTGRDSSLLWGGGIVWFPTLLMIVFRRKYPKWWYDWNLNLTKFGIRVASYIFLLRDEYPSTDEDQEVHVEMPYPDVDQELNQWMPLVKWFLAIPHYIVLAILWAAMLICVIITWFVIFFTGRYPRELHEFVVGVMRWTLRVEAYAFLLTTDEYPPFTLRA